MEIPDQNHAKPPDLRWNEEWNISKQIPAIYVE